MGQIGDDVFVAMELVVGETLTGWLDQEQRSARQILDVFVAAGRGLAAAHAAGIVHRDFKPDNVLIGADGAVRVTDFGLARAPGPAASPRLAAPSAPTHHERLTRTGALLGTPAYMSPEQLAGGAVDARADQYSFSVSLHEALHGARPSATSSAEGWQTAPEARRAASLPRRVRAALQRGLSASADDRFPSMEPLLEALSPAKSARRGWGRAAIVLGLAIAGGVGVGALVRRGPEGTSASRCTAEESGLAGIWDGATRSTVRQAFTASGNPYAPAVFDEFDRTLTRYGEAWVRQAVESCRVTRGPGAQPEASLVARECLDDLRVDFTALVKVFATADAAAVNRAVSAAYELTPAVLCSDPASRRPGGTPPDVPRRPAMRGIRVKLAEGRALLEATRFADGLRLTREALAEARTLAYRPLEAEALILHGDLLRESGDLRAAEQTLLEALQAADASRHDEARAEAMIGLVGVVGRDQARFGEGERLARLADAALDRLGRPAPLASRLDAVVGTLLAQRGQLDEARARFERALAAHEWLGRKPRVAADLSALGNVANFQGKYAEALAFYQKAAALQESLLGADHPSVAPYRDNAGIALYQLGDYRRAVEVHRDVLILRERDPDHPDVAITLNNLANALQARGDRAEATAHFRRALAITERHLGGEHPTVATMHNNLGSLLADLGRPDEGLEHLARALSIQTRVLGPDHSSVALSLTSIGQALAHKGRHAAARARYLRAVPILEKALGPEHPDLVDPLLALGLAELALDHRARAVPPLQRALAIGEAARVTPDQLTEIRAALAKVRRPR